MKNLVIAKRYAKALFNLAQEQGQIEQYGQELDEFVRLFGELPDLADAIQNPLYPEATRPCVPSRMVRPSKSTKPARRRLIRKAELLARKHRGV